MAMISRAIVKSDWLNIASADTTHDAMIDRMIDMVASEIEGICNQPIESKAVTRYEIGNNRNSLLLPYTTAVTLSSVSSRSNPADSWVVASGFYVWPTNAGYSLHSTDGFTEPYYKIELTAGYTVIPADIQLCAYEMVKEVYYQTPFAAEAERFGVSVIGETDAGVAITKTIVQMRNRVKPRLERYIVHGV